MIPFSIEEKVFVARTDVAETFEEVLQIAVDVYEFSKQEKVMDMPAPQSSESETESTDGEESEQQTEAQAESSDEDQPNTQGGASSSGADLEDVRDDWYDEDGNLMDDEGGSEGGDTSETQRAFDNASEKSFFSSWS